MQLKFKRIEAVAEKRKDESMVSTATLIAVIITFCISFVLPIVAWIVYGVRNKGKGVWTAWLLGAVGFFIMQMIIRIPIMNMLALTAGFQSFVTKGPLSIFNHKKNMFCPYFLIKTLKRI